ncbi:hypothetical protein BGZ65_001206, partial [Modicella reniformis]
MAYIVCDSDDDRIRSESQAIVRAEGTVSTCRIEDIPPSCGSDLTCYIGSRHHDHIATNNGFQGDGSDMDTTCFRGDGDRDDADDTNPFKLRITDPGSNPYTPYEEKTYWTENVEYMRLLLLERGRGDGLRTFHLLEGSRSTWKCLNPWPLLWWIITFLGQSFLNIIMASSRAFVNTIQMTASLLILVCSWAWKLVIKIFGVIKCWSKFMGSSRRPNVLLLIMALGAGSVYYFNSTPGLYSRLQFDIQASRLQLPAILSRISFWKSLYPKDQFSHVLKTVNIHVFRNWVPLRRQPPRLRSQIQVPENSLHSIKDLETRIQWIQKSIQDLEGSDNRLANDIESKAVQLNQRVTDVEDRLDAVASDVGLLRRYIANGQWIEKVVLDLLQEHIPKYVAVTKDPRTGEIHIPAGFWDKAREWFVTKDKVNESIEEVLSNRLEENNKVLWNKFLDENERALKNLVNNQIEMVSQREFLRLIKAEASTIWDNLKDKVVNHLEQEGLLKVTKDAWTHRGDEFLPVDSRSLTDIERQVITVLIDEALERHSIDVLARPDYALSNIGGRIIPELTFADYSYQETPTLLGRLGLMYLIPPNPRVERRAIRAIQADVVVGSCWAMKGTEGQIGIRLAREIIITQVTIEHVDPRIALDRGSAPKEMEIWSLISPVATKKKHHSTKDKQDKDATEGGGIKSSPVMGAWWKEGSPEQGASLLETIEYQYSDHVDGG